MIKVPQLYKDLNIAGCFSWENEAIFLEDTIRIAEPKNILEIGFFNGASAFMWLYLSKANLTSVDPLAGRDHQPGRTDVIAAAFPGRFTFYKKSSMDIRPDLQGKKFELAFIDGAHEHEFVRNDLNLALEMDIPYVLVDDFCTSVLDVYLNEFQDKFLQPIRIYHRAAQFQGRPIPIVLLKKKTNNMLRFTTDE